MNISRGSSCVTKCYFSAVFVLMLAFSLPVCAKSIDQDMQLWTAVTVQGPVASRVRGYLEVQPRLGSDVSNIDRLIVRPAIYYMATDHISVWLGYAWQPIFEPGFINENRFWQQVQHDAFYGRFRLAHRFRLEERFISTNSGDAHVRFRYNLRALYQLNEDRTLNAVVQNEAFVNLNTVPRGLQSGFDQERLYLAVNYWLDAHLGVDVGYMANYIHRPTSASDRYNHIALVNWNFLF